MASAPTAFISHSSRDATLASRLSSLMEERGVRCWIAPRDVRPGKPYAEEIVQGIQGCGAFILLATPNSVVSPNVLNELEQAHRSSRAIYTVMIDHPRLSGEVSYYVARLHWLEGKSEGLDAIARRLSEVLEGSRKWEAVAASPTWGRRLRHAAPSFVGAAIAIFLGTLFIAAIGIFLVNGVRHSVRTDYRSLGWVTLSQTDPPSGNVVGHLWLGDASMPFSRVQIHAQVRGSAGSGRKIDLTPQVPRNASGQAEFNIEMPPNAEVIVTYLLVPTESDLFCVRQRFAVSATELTLVGPAEVTPAAHNDCLSQG